MRGMYEFQCVRQDYGVNAFTLERQILHVDQCLNVRGSDLAENSMMWNFRCRQKTMPMPPTPDLKDMSTNQARQRRSELLFLQRKDLPTTPATLPTKQLLVGKWLTAPSSFHKVMHIDHTPIRLRPYSNDNLQQT